MKKGRTALIRKVGGLLSSHNILLIYGPARCGKTALAVHYCNLVAPTLGISSLAVSSNSFPSGPISASSMGSYFDFESEQDVERLRARLALGEILEPVIILDNIHKNLSLISDLFSKCGDFYTRFDKKIILISIDFEKLVNVFPQYVTQHIGVMQITPLTYQEERDEKKLWLRGGFPESLLANSEEESFAWRKSYIKSSIDANLIVQTQYLSDTKRYQSNIEKFVQLVTQYHGNLFNASAIGAQLSLSHPTIRRYLGILERAFMIRILKPWIVPGLRKRQIKTPRVYIKDSGLYHALLNIETVESLHSSIKLVLSWKYFALEQIIQTLLTIHHEQFYCWSSHNGASLDLFVQKGGKNFGFKIDYSAQPYITPSVAALPDELDLRKLFIIYPGEDAVQLSTKVIGLGFSRWMNSFI